MNEDLIIPFFIFIVAPAVYYFGEWHKEEKIRLNLSQFQLKWENKERIKRDKNNKKFNNKMLKGSKKRKVNEEKMIKLSNEHNEQMQAMLKGKK